VRVVPLPEGGHVEFFFGDGSGPPDSVPVEGGQAVSPIHLYAKAGQYALYANAYDPDGLFWGQARYVKIAPRPGAPGDIDGGN
jgi:hypothetical protein